ncbi:RNA polymerase subunit AC19 [Podila epigama]|nr:RNA polymerase subunit AC19 [Podila epigama]
MTDKNNGTLTLMTSSEDSDKITIIPGTMSDAQCATFCLQDEDHTLGNALRWAVMKNPDVDFVSYSMPHPSEPKTNFRVQTSEKTTAIDALLKGLDDLSSICSHVMETFNNELMRGEFEYDDEDEK